MTISLAARWPRSRGPAADDALGLGEQVLAGLPAVPWRDSTTASCLMSCARIRCLLAAATASSSSAESARPARIQRSRLAWLADRFLVEPIAQGSPSNAAEADSRHSRSSSPTPSLAEFPADGAELADRQGLVARQGSHAMIFRHQAARRPSD